MCFSHLLSCQRVRANKQSMCGLILENYYFSSKNPLCDSTVTRCSGILKFPQGGEKLCIIPNGVGPLPSVFRYPTWEGGE